MGNAFVLALILSILSAYCFKRAFLEETPRKVVGRMAWFFLALLALESITKHPPNIIYILLGLFYIILTLGCSYLWGQLFRTKYDNAIIIASTTFGAGNRGYAFLVTLCGFPIFAEKKGEIIFTFIQIDAVIVIWLIVIIPLLLSRTSGGEGQGEPPKIIHSVTTFASEVGAAPFFIMVIILLGWLLPQPILEYISQFLSPTKEARSFTLLYLSMTIVFISTKVTTRSFFELLSDLTHFYLPRILPVLTFAIIIIMVSGKRLDNAIISCPILLPLIVLSICPPSNFLVVLMEQASEESGITQVSDVNIITTAIFMVLLSLASIPETIKSAIAWLFPT